ncbi:hypothetical protein [Yaniella halotolerans]|uniref:hypothetical protein n=1 Tax=Yaniella halotolerans TaxID=225453 RepID=UPI0003B5E4DD|nr:hypothetical protein [Yaniella halotolerans]
MSNNPYDGQPPMGGGPGVPGGQGQPYGPGSGGSKPTNGKSVIARVLSSDSDLPHSVRQVQLSTLVSAAGAIVLGLISAIISGVVLSSEFRAAGLESSFLTGGTVFSAIFGLILTAGLYVLVLIPLLGGKNWGRILGIIFAILGGLSGLFGLFTALTMFSLSAAMAIVSLLTNIVYVATAVWFLIFVFRPEVAAWYSPAPYTGYQQNWGPGGQPGSYGYGGQTPPQPGQYPGQEGYGQNPQTPGNPYGGPSGPGQGPGGQGPQQGPPQGPPPTNS